ncbi:MAG: VCBS repeat-containing protein [Candidatus Kerfeldbacteria bacterium]|nr:VCBS repeat-containing protein [Candidatus Kerfeldbacteria bacterium]
MNFIRQSSALKKAITLGAIALLASIGGVVAHNTRASSGFVSAVWAFPGSFQTSTSTSYTVGFTLSQSASSVSFYFVPEHAEDVQFTGKQFGLDSAEISITDVSGTLSTGSQGSHHKKFTPTSSMSAGTYSASFTNVVNPADGGEYKIGMNGPGETSNTKDSSLFHFSSTNEPPPGGGTPPPGGDTPPGGGTPPPGGGTPDQGTPPTPPPPPGEFEHGELPPGFNPGGPGGPSGSSGGCSEDDTPLMQGNLFLPDAITGYTSENQVFAMVEIRESGGAGGQEEGPGGHGGEGGGDFGNFYNAPVNQDGQYQFCDDRVTSGAYDAKLRLDGPTIYGAPDKATVTLTVGSTVTKDFTLDTLNKSVAGTVSYSDTGAGVSGAEVTAFSIGGKGGNFSRTTTASDGSYTMFLSDGTWELRVQPAPFNPQSGSVTPNDWVYAPEGMPEQITFADNDTAETESKDFEVQRTDATVTGVIENANGTPVQNGFLNIGPADGFGMGNGTQVNTNGQFTADLVGGKKYRLEMFSNDPTLTLPDTTFFVKEDEDKNLGTIRMKQKTERVTSRVVDADGNGISGIRVHFFGGPGSGFAQAQSDSDGYIDTYLSRPGKWNYQIEFFNTNYLGAGHPTPFVVEPNETLPLPDIVLRTATATVTMYLVDADGTLQEDIRTFASASPADDNTLPWAGAEVNAGVSTFNLVAGRYIFEPRFDFGQAKVAVPAELDVVEGANSVNVLIQDPNVTVHVQLVNGDGDPITGLFARAMFMQGKSGKEAGVNPSDGTATALLYASEENTKFHADAFIDPFGKSTTKYISTGDEELILSPGDDVDFELMLRETDATIRGQLLDPEGNPMPNQLVKADNKKFEAQKDSGPAFGGPGPGRGFADGVLTDEDGNYSIPVLSDTQYSIGTGRPSGTDFMPAKVDGVSVAEDEEVTVDLTFREAAGTIHGEVTLPDGSAPTSGKAVVFCADGAYATGELDEDGAYSVPITGDTVCEARIEAVDESNTYYESENQTVAVDDSPDETVEPELVEQFTLPDPVTTTIDSSQTNAITLSDNTVITIPALSLASSGDVTVTVSPEVGLAGTDELQALSYGFNITAIASETEVTSLNGATISMSIPYDEERLAARRIDEEDLEGKFLTEGDEAWDEVASVTTDTTENIVTISTDHLSTYAPVGTVNGSGTGNTSVLDSTADNDIIIAGRGTAGPSVRILNEEGGQVGSFMAYASTLRGTWQAVGGDIDGDGTREVVTATGTGYGPHIRGYEVDGTLLDDYFAYDTSFRGGVNVAVGDVNGDGRDDVITAPQSGASNVQVYTYSPVTEEFSRLAWKMTYDAGYKGGVNLAVADLDGDQSAEIITVPAMGSTNLRAYSYDATEGTLELDGWTWAYGSGFKGGANVAAGDVNGDGNDEVIVAPYWGSPNVRVLSYTAADGFDTYAWTFAYDTNFKGGVQVAVGDVDGDGNADVVTAPQNGTSNVRVYGVTEDEMTLIDWEMAYGSGFNGGVNVLATDVDNDGSAEVVTAPRMGRPNVRVYSYNASEEALELDEWFWGLPSGFSGGVNLAY